MSDSVMALSRLTANTTRLSPFATIWAVTYYEMRLQWYNPIFWVLVVLCAATIPLVGFVALVVSPSTYVYVGTTPSLIRLDALNFTGVSAVYTALAPLAVLFVLQRDRQRRVFDLLWTRPLTSPIYIIAKALALTILLGSLAAGGEVLYWGLASLRASTRLPTFLFVAEWAVFMLPVILLAIAFTLVLSLLLPHPVIGLAVWWASVWYLSFYQLQDMLQWQNLYLSGVWYSPGVRFGPDTPLLIGNRLIWLAIVLGLLGLAPVLYRLRYSLSAWNKGSTLWVAGLLVGSLAIGIWGVRILDAGVAQVMNPAPPAVADVQSSNVNISGYEAHVDLSPSTSQVSGRVSFTLLPGSRQPTSSQAVLSFITNTGIVVDRVSVGHEAAHLQRRTGLASMVVPEKLPQTVSVLYHGFLRISRSTYGTFNQEAFRHSPGGTSSGYVSPSFTYLTSASDWYPIPQMVNATQTTPPNLHWRSLVITLPAQGTIVDSATLHASHAGRRILTWTRLSSGFLPGALLVNCQSCQTQQVGHGQLVAARVISAVDAENAYTPFVSAYQAIGRVMGEQVAPTIVAVPTFLAAPLSGGSLVLVPEEFWATLLSRWYAPYLTPGRLTYTQQRRLALAAMASAWWSGHTVWRGAAPEILAGDPQEPYGWRTLLSYGGDRSPLATVTGELAARRVLGDDYFKHEWAFRQWLRQKGYYSINNAFNCTAASGTSLWHEAQRTGVLVLTCGGFENGDLSTAHLVSTIPQVGITHMEAWLRRQMITSLSSQ